MNAEKREPHRRFWSKVEVGDWRDCWPWKAGLSSTGYGIYYAGGGKKNRKFESAHRHAFALSYGHPGEKHVRHRCDNRACVNPYHLLAGSNQDNIDDKVRRGRQPVGEAHSRAVLNEGMVRAIRSDPRSTRKIAASLGVSQSCVRDVMSGRTWSHVQ